MTLYHGLFYNIAQDQTNMIFYYFFGLLSGVTASLIVFLTDKYIKYILKISLPDQIAMQKAIKDAEAEMSQYLDTDLS